MIGPVTGAIRAMQTPHDPMRGNIEALLQAPTEPHPDEELIALGRAYDKAVSERGVAGNRCEEAELRAEGLRPKDPETLIVTNFDAMDSFPDRGCRKHDVRGLTWTAEQIEEIRSAPARKAYFVPGGLQVCERTARRKAEILAAYDEHMTKVDAVDEACGLLAAEAEYERLRALAEEIEDRIIAIGAKTLAGLGVKVRVYADNWGPPRISDAVTADRQIVQSVFVDLALLGGAA